MRAGSFVAALSASSLRCRNLPAVARQGRGELLVLGRGGAAVLRAARTSPPPDAVNGPKITHQHTLRGRWRTTVRLHSFPPEENQEDADIWTRFMAMGQTKGLEWAKMMVAAQGVQQPLETPAPTNANKVQPSDSGLCLLNDKSVAAPAKRKRLARATAGSKLKRAKQDMVDSNLPEGPSTSQTDSGPRRARKDNEEQEAAGADGVPIAPGASAPIAQ
ncbi:hypothetical protein NDU88_006365 [Pleurodeles waltl]|uniref:Uncharacterized protein n=1 Tax=Pleurodeles waltl TaxID=8319 RepID=A0AAV7TDA3_PLEWA|nr:hypothetical protein NDU88_006365 [Pleurodeles waltl]